MLEAWFHLLILFSFMFTKAQELVWLVTYVMFDIGCGFKYANYMGACEDKHCPAVTQIQIGNYRNLIWKFNLWDHWKLI
jgi:hypothetical protein